MFYRWFVHIHNRWHRDIFWFLYFFRLHYILQLWRGTEILWRFYCAMEPTSIQKMYLNEKWKREKKNRICIFSKWTNFELDPDAFVFGSSSERVMCVFSHLFPPPTGIFIFLTPYVLSVGLFLLVTFKCAVWFALHVILKFIEDATVTFFHFLLLAPSHPSTLCQSKHQFMQIIITSISCERKNVSNITFVEARKDLRHVNHVCHFIISA